MNARGQRIVVFGDSLSKHAHDSSPEIWDVNADSQRSSSAPGDLLASMLAEQGAEAVRVNARVSRSAWNFWARENTQALIASDAQFRPTRVVFVLGTNDVGLNATLDREAFAKLRDTYKALGAETWAIGPFANTSKPDAGVDQVAKTMRDVFGMRFIDGRSISTLIHPGRDGLHYDTNSARVLALAMTDALISRISPTTLWSSIGFGALGIGAAVIAGLAWKNRKRGLAGPKEDQRAFRQIIRKDASADALDVAEDFVEERELKLSDLTVANWSNDGNSGTINIGERGSDDVSNVWWDAEKHPNGGFTYRIDTVFDNKQMKLAERSDRDQFKTIEEARRHAAADAWAVAKALRKAKAENVDFDRAQRLAQNALSEDNIARKSHLYGAKQSLGALSRKDEKELQELIKQPGVEVLDVAQDRLLERNERVSTFAKTGGVATEHSIASFQLDLGRDKITWWIKKAGMGRCVANFRPFSDGILIGDGTEISAGGGREPKPFIESYGTQSSEYCERAAASTAWQIAKTLKRMPGMPHGKPDNLILIKNAQIDIREAINRDKDQDHSEPEELYGLGGRYRKGPTDKEFETWVKFQDLIRDPDPAVMEVAEDMIEQSGHKFSKLARVVNSGYGGSFTLSPLYPADVPVTAVYWRIEQGSRKPGKKGSKAFNYGPEIEIFFQGQKMAGNSFNPAYGDPEHATREAASAAGAAMAWSVAKALKKLSANANAGEVFDATSKALQSHFEQKDVSDDTKFVWGSKKQLYGASGKDVSFHELVRDEDPNAMQVAEDLLLERSLKLREVTGGMRAKHYTIEMNSMAAPRDQWKMVQAHVHEPESPEIFSQHRSEAAAQRALKRARAGAFIIHEPETLRTNERWLIANKRYEIELDIANGSVRAKRTFFYIPRDSDDLRKRAVADAWAIAKAIKPLPLDASKADVERIINEASEGNPMHNEELFGLGATTIVDGKRYDGSQAALVRSGARQVPCKSGLDRKSLATCWTRALGRTVKPKDVRRAVIENIPLGGFRVAYKTVESRADGIKTIRNYVSSDKGVITYPTLEAAMKYMRSLKRRAFWAWVEDEQGNHVPVKGAMKPFKIDLGDSRDDAITYAIKDSASRTKPWASSKKAFISDVFKQLEADARTDGMTLEDFKRELVRLHKAGKVKLARADLVAAMPAQKVAASETKANGAEFHFVQR